MSTCENETQRHSDFPLLPISKIEVLDTNFFDYGSSKDYKNAGNIFHGNSHFAIFNGDAGAIKLFSKDRIFQNEFEYITDSTPYIFSPCSAILLPQIIGIIDCDNLTIILFDHCGKYVTQINFLKELNAFRKKNSRSVGNSNYKITKKNRFLYIPLEMQHPPYSEEYFENRGIIGKFDLYSGTLERQFGWYPEVYKQRKYLSASQEYYFDIDTINNLVYISYESSEKIFVFDEMNHKVREFGEAPIDVKYPRLVKNEDDFLLEFFEIRDEAHLFAQIYFDHMDESVYRIVLLPSDSLNRRVGCPNNERRKLLQKYDRFGKLTGQFELPKNILHLIQFNDDTSLKFIGFNMEEQKFFESNIRLLLRK